MLEMREKILSFLLSCTGAQPILMAALIMLCSTCLSIVVCVVRSSKHNRPFSGNKKKEKAKSSESTAKSDENNNNNFQLKLFRKLARNSPPNRPQELCVEETNREVYKERLRSAALAKQAPLCIGTPQHDMRVSAKVEAQKPTNHMLVPSSVHVDQKTSNLSVDNTLFIGRTVKSRTRSPDQKNRLDSATRDDDSNVKLIEGETMVPLQVPPNANHGLLPSLTVEELADFHRERRELICRFEAKRLELREDRRKRGLPSKRSTTSSSCSDPLSTSSCSNGEVFPPPLSLKEQQVIESTATSTTPMPLTPSIVSASLHTSSLNSTLAGISSLRLLNEDVLSSVPLTAYSSKKNHASSSPSSGTSSGKTTIFTFQSDIIQTSDGSKASSKGGNEDNRDGGRSPPPVTSVELPASLVVELGLSDDEHERLKPFLHKWRRERSDDYFAFHFDELKQTITYTLCVKKNSNKSSIVMKKSDIPLGRETVFTDYPTIGLIQWIKIDLDERDLVIVGRANKPREKTTLDRLVLLDNGSRLKNIEYDNGKETSRIHYFVREK